MEDKREAGEAFLEGVCEMGQGVNWEVFSDRGGRDGGSPVEGEVDRGEAPREMLGHMIGPEGREEGEGCQRSGGGWVVGLGGAGNP